MLKKSLFVVFLMVGVMLMGGTAMADTSVAWLSPANNSSYPVGTNVNPVGQASGNGVVGGTGLDLMLVIDVSGSMGWNNQAGLNAAKAAANAMIDSLPDNTTQVGIVKFDSSADTVELLQDLTTNKADLKATVNSLTAGGGTYIGTGIAAATAELTSVRAIAGHSKMQVVLSDGDSLGNPVAAAEAAWNAGITVHTVGIPGHVPYQMSNIAAAGHGVYTNNTDLSKLQGIFDGTGGNLVALDHVDIELNDGTWIYDIATDGLGNFTLPNWAIQLGDQDFIAHAYGTDGTYASAKLTLNGYGGAGTVPEPGTMLLLGCGLAGLAVLRRKKLLKK